ncbi:MAG: diheme cytochrome c [Alphaproteobacteria bacterium]
MRIATLLASLLLAASPVLADDDRVQPIGDPLVRKECGSCHMAFQPAFLPARSWTRLMDGLANHFGDDATLPPDTAQAIRAYLTANAGDVVGGKHMRRLAPGSTPLRITETPNFTRKHAFPDTVWTDPKVVTKSNCPACHRGAEQGLYDDE